jgi:hypothetical protein
LIYLVAACDALHFALSTTGALGRTPCLIHPVDRPDPLPILSADHDAAAEAGGPDIGTFVFGIGVHRWMSCGRMNGGEATNSIRGTNRGRPMKSLKFALSIFGALLIVAGLIWAAQGSGYFRYPASSFMIDETRWVYRGVMTAIVGSVVMLVARRL